MASPASRRLADSLGARSSRLGAVFACVVAGLALVTGSADAATKTINFEVSRAGTTNSDFDHFHNTVDAVLGAPRGWSLNGGVRFRHVSRGGQFTVRLTDPRIVGSYPGCSSYYSCRVGRYVMINDNRWRYGTRSFADEPRHHYRQLVINHEVGHALGFGHASCGRSGSRAPVMMQQSKGLGGCRANPWPLSSERTTLARRLGVSIGPKPPGIELGERIGPIELGHSRGEALGRLGTPTSERRSGNSRLLAWSHEGIRALLGDQGVTAVSTDAEDYRTPNQLRVGSTTAQVRYRLTGESCEAAACVVNASGALTKFFLEEGEVVKIRVEARDTE